jgi:glycosyltransferase involved in cell wall biosynthesis
MKKAAHFLLIPELLYSPPNDAIIKAYIENDYSVDVFSPGKIENFTSYGKLVKTYSVSYTWMWLFRNICNVRWFQYSCVSGTSEDPLAIVGLLAYIYQKKSFALVDEIKSGSYSGDRSIHWKRLCRFGIRKAEFSIVNDINRIDLLREYVPLKRKQNVIVYPGCYMQPPTPNRSSSEIKKNWGFPENAFVVASSGGFNMTAGADWLINALKDLNEIYSVIQPLGITPLSMFLLENLDYRNRLYIQKERLSWEDAWKQSIGFDIGLCIYLNPAAQFQKMGISSNRLCMFIAMGIPVIASRQDSFSFLEQYNCGILVNNYEEFKLAIQTIKENCYQMKANCRKCYEEYLHPLIYYQRLSQEIKLLCSH